MLRCILVPTLEIVTSIGGESWHGPAQNGENFDFEVKKLNLTPPPPPPPKKKKNKNKKKQKKTKTIGILTKGFYTYGPNLVILA